jgi:hypothetical protein
MNRGPCGGEYNVSPAGRNRGSAQQKEKEAMAEKAYCVKCKATVQMKDEKKVKMKNGRPAMKGKCAKCGTGVYKILPMK